MERTIAGGTTQVVILGAGFDSHAYRCPELLAPVSVFEVDRPAMQVVKKPGNEVLGGAPVNLTYVAIDFQREDLRTKADGTPVGAQAIAEAMARMTERMQSAGQSAPQGQQMSPEQMREQQRLMAYRLAEAVVA